MVAVARGFDCVRLAHQCAAVDVDGRSRNKFAVVRAEVDHED